ncbi:helix-turn-helix transcriptional regulator [Microbacterium gorillae]|uniref:helix-turn-helix transcriptional regulator n=1 Tax=Microbacterium gorillae TaxID=1231063 RepID=UPI000B253627|nr:AraC family transcriptional regulator [Microbacterium gorillae]
MVTQDSPAFERMLAALDWEVASSRRHDRFTAWPARPDPDRTAVVYVRSGRVRLTFGSPDGRMSASCRETLDAGDILIVAGRLGLQLRGDADTEVIVTELVPARGARTIATSFPDLMVVRDFADAEPAVAGLAAAMGPKSPGASRVGDATVCARIATTIVAAAMRAWTERGCTTESWLISTEDPHVGRVIDAIHDEPGRAWTVGSLATIAAMSRTVFAERFRDLVGQSPATYLANVRMDAAMTHLERDGQTVSQTAHLLGYASEDGFSRAFRRHTGLTPAAWRRNQLARV